MDEELIAACLRWLHDGPPATVPPVLADEDDVIPLSVDIDADVAAVAVLRWWQAPPAHPGSAPQAPQPLIDVRDFCLVGNDWKAIGGGVGSPLDHYPLTDRPRAAELGAHLLWQGGGSAHTGETLPDESIYVHDARLRASSQVVELQVGSRRLTVPSHGYLAVCWSSRRAAPTVEALASDGSVLATLDLDHMPGAHQHHKQAP